MKRRVQEICLCDECGREFIVPEGRAPSKAYLVDYEKDECTEVDYCIPCTKGMLLKVKHVRNQSIT